ncbi:MAG: EthD family reductase [Acidobacteriota bacterium]
MIKVSVLYPRTAESTFDMKYYCDHHMPMVTERFGPLCKAIAVEEGLLGSAPGSDPPFMAMGHMYFESIEEFQTAFQPHAAELMGDVKNYTNVEPIIQISEVRIASANFTAAGA